ncbi:hypothetical protein DUZ99_08390 [Xylanibacillus composti]|nr:hypothetical protein [Xylanibacillus composti]
MYLHFYQIVAIPAMRAAERTTNRAPQVRASIPSGGISLHRLECVQEEFPGMRLQHARQQV